MKKMNTDEIREHFNEMIDTLSPEYENIIEGYLMVLIFDENITGFNIGSDFSKEILNYPEQRKIDILMHLIKVLGIDITFILQNYGL